MAKVEKLLALSQSSNEHEAALAMQKANDLIEKYHIQELGFDQEYRYGFGIIDRKRKRIESYQRRICTILHDFFFVRVVLSSLYDPLCNDTYKTIELLGTKENVAIAEYCYHFLENRLASLWSLNRKRFKGTTRTEKNSYYLGLLRGFYQKLQEQKRRKQISAWNLRWAIWSSRRKSDWRPLSGCVFPDSERYREVVSRCTAVPIMREWKQAKPSPLPKGSPIRVERLVDYYQDKSLMLLQKKICWRGFVSMLDELGARVAAATETLYIRKKRSPEHKLTDSDGALQKEADMDNSIATSPRILSSGWGKMEIERIGSGKDFKLWPGGGRTWDWSEYGTGHSRGIQQGDVQELITQGCQVVILTTGRFKRLKVPKKTVDILKAQSIEVVVADTKKAIQLYNDFAAKGMAVGGLFHSTC